VILFVIGTMTRGWSLRMRATAAGIAAFMSLVDIVDESPSRRGIRLASKVKLCACSSEVNILANR
jgi:hypothetical protein